MKLMSEHSIDTIVHFAAESHVDRSIAGPDAFVTISVIGIQPAEGTKAIWLDRGTPLSWTAGTIAAGLLKGFLLHANTDHRDGSGN